LRSINLYNLQRNKEFVEAEQSNGGVNRDWSIKSCIRYVRNTLETYREGREVRKVIVQSWGKHPLGSTELMYLPRKLGGRGLKSLEEKYKLTKIKAAVKLYSNPDPVM